MQSHDEMILTQTEASLLLRVVKSDVGLEGNQYFQFRSKYWIMKQEFLRADGLLTCTSW